MDTRIFEVSMTVDTSAYTDGDVLATTFEIQNFFERADKVGILDALTIVDKDVQAFGVDFLFMKSNVSIGSLNGVPNLTDTDAEQIMAVVSLLSTDFKTIAAVSKIAQLAGMSRWLKNPTTTSIWVAAIVRGTPTFVANALKLKMGVIWL